MTKGSGKDLSKGSVSHRDRLENALEVIFEGLCEKLLTFVEVCISDVHDVRLVNDIESNFLSNLPKRLSFDLYSFAWKLFRLLLILVLVLVLMLMLVLLRTP